MSYILIVDDERVVRDLITETLSNIGFETAQARHGEEALEIIAEARPDAIILDLNMPIMDGFMTLAHLHRREATRGIPVIVLTGLSNREHEVTRMPAVIGVMQKGNFDIVMLEQMLSRSGVMTPR